METEDKEAHKQDVQTDSHHDEDHGKTEAKGQENSTSPYQWAKRILILIILLIIYFQWIKPWGCNKIAKAEAETVKAEQAAAAKAVHDAEYPASFDYCNVTKNTVKKMYLDPSRSKLLQDRTVSSIVCKSVKFNKTFTTRPGMSDSELEEWMTYPPGDYDVTFSEDCVVKLTN